MKIQVAEILNLSIKERIRLVEEIWESIAASPEEIAGAGPLRSATAGDG